VIIFEPVGILLFNYVVFALSTMITAFNTSKGELVQSILYPKPVDFKFNTDTYKYVGGMALIAVVGVIFALILGVRSFYSLSFHIHVDHL